MSLLSDPVVWVILLLLGVAGCAAIAFVAGVGQKFAALSGIAKIGVIIILLLLSIVVLLGIGLTIMAGGN